MTSMTRSSITGLYHPKRSIDSIGSLSSDNQSLSQTKISAIDRILHADKSGFLPIDSLLNSSRSFPNLNLSTSLEQSVLQAQLKRVISCNEAMNTSIKRLRTETTNSMEDLRDKNESLERSLHESRIKISELEYLLDKSKQPTIPSTDNATLISTYQQQSKTLQNEKFELQQSSKQVNQLEQTIRDLKHQLIDSENKLKLTQFEQDKLNSINKNISKQLIEQTKQIEQLETRIIELELIISTMNRTNVVNQSLIDDVKRISDIRYENEQLKKEIELLKLKCNERTLHDEEIRRLRKEVRTSNDYRILIAKQEAEILKLHEKLAK